MKKITLLLMMIMTTCFLNAQVVAYSFSQSNGTYTEITGGTLLGTETSDDQRFTDPATASVGGAAIGVGLPIGFNFVFNGVIYDRFGVNNNGWISLGMSSLGASAVNMNSSSGYTPTRSTSTAVTDDLVARISGLGRDLQAQTGSTLRYELTGTAPNQVLVIQFKNYRKFNATGDNFNFQIRLKETSNLVEIVYGTQVNNATSSTYDVGLRASPAATASNFNSRTSLTSWSATTSSVDALGAITMDATIIPASGLTFTWTPPTCPGATGLTLTSLTSSSANVTWTEPTPLPSSGYEYVITSTVGLPTIAGTASTTNTASATGLTANTTYYVYVRSNCGSSFGNWILSGTFKTLCDEVTAFVQNFDAFPSGTTSLPDCWSKAGTSANVYITTGAVAPMSPLNRLYMNVSATTSAFAIMAPVSNLQANTHRLKFKAYASAANKSISIGYFTTPGDVASYIEIEPVQLPSTVIASTQEFTIIPTSIPAGVKQLVFNITQPTPSATTVYIDDVKWEINSSCVEPNTLTATLITSTSATLGWINGGTATIWDIQYGPNNFALGSGTILNSVTNPYLLSGLLPNTNYQYYVRAVCAGPINSSWSGPFSFKTQCDDVTDYFEDFEAYPSSTTSLPDCWSRGGTSTSTYITTGAVAPMSPTKRLYMFASGTTPTEGYAILPAVSNLQANTHRLKFKAYASAANRFLVIGYLTDPSDVTTFVQLEEVTLPGTVVANTQEITVIPTGVPAGIKYLAIKNPGYPGSTTTAYIDDVAWEVIPACTNPTSVSASAVVSNSASISWTTDASATSWEIEYGAPGFTLGTGTIVSASTNPFTVTGLMAQTSYQYYVRSICAGPTTSANSLSGSFTTACAAVTPDYLQDFATFPAICWNRSDAGTLATGPTGTGTGFWANDGFANVGTSGAIKVNLYIANRIGWMISPIMDLTTGGYRVRYDVAATNYASSTTPATIGSDDSVQFVMSSDGGATWTSMETYNIANTPTVASTTKIYNIPAVTSANVLFAFLADEGPVDDSQDWELFVDNFVVETPPATAPACATNVVGTPDAACGNFPFAISWDAIASALGYKITIGTTTGGTDIANNVDLGLVTSYSYAAPNINTTYYYTVIPYNSVGDATGCTEQSLITSATGCYCTSVPSSNDGSGITNVQLGTADFPNGDVTYFDHSATAVNVSQGLNTNLQVSFATGYTYNTYIWIDFNDDYTFDTATELVYTGESTNANPTTLDASFLMSATAALGTHKMRIVTADFLPAADPCYSGSYGVTLDFSVNIQPAPSCIPPTALTASGITSSSANLGWTETGTATIWDIEWGTSGFTPTGTPNIAATTTNPHNLTGLTSNTVYSFYVRANCGGTSGQSPWSGPFSFTTTCNATNVPYVMDFETAVLPALPNCTSQQNVGTGNLWATNTAPAYGFPTNTLQYSFNGSSAADVWFYTQGINLTAGTTYAIAFDYGCTSVNWQEKLKVAYGTSASALAMTNAIVDFPNVINSTPLNSSTQFTPPSTGVYYFGFNAYSNVDQFYLFVDNINIDVFLSTNSFDNSSFVAYPNPVIDVLNLSYSSEISYVKVINLLGQEVISRKVNNTTSQIDMTSLTAGAYIVNVTVGDVIKTIKVIKQ
jgi:hypothetical protein